MLVSKITLQVGRGHCAKKCAEKVSSIYGSLVVQKWMSLALHTRLNTARSVVGSVTTSESLVLYVEFLLSIFVFKFLVDQILLGSRCRGTAQQWS